MQKLSEKNNKAINMNKKMIDFVSSLNKKQFDEFIDVFSELLSVDERDELQKHHASKSLMGNVIDQIANRYVLNNWVLECYNEQINKINYLMSNDKLINKIGGIKILLYGPTGTGKTSIASEIIKTNSDISYEVINFINLISSKMGQTQINLINLAGELNQKNQKIIIFLDELDSIVTSRINSDLGEHSRIIATFIKFLDLLSSKIIFICATNFVKSIDSAILRRFNIKVETKTISLNKTLIFLRSEGFIISKQRENFLLKHIIPNYDNFSFSDVKMYLDAYNLDLELNLVKNKWTHFLKYFWNKFDINLYDNSLSKRDIVELKTMLKGKLNS